MEKMRNVSIRNLSIRKTILLYMLINLFVSFLFSAFLMLTAEDVQQRIWSKYSEGEQWEFSYFGIPVRPPMEELLKVDLFLSELCDFLQTYSFLVVSSAGTVITVFLFYRKKIRPPLLELEAASKAIAEDNLDFSVAYKSSDELGRLCAEYERMRGQLVENNKQTWRLLEQEKALRAAVAHDLRSPLSVLKGYQEMLLELVPDREFDRERLLEMVREGIRQVDRMELFLDRMRSLSRLEDRKVETERTELCALVAECIRTSRILSEKGGIEISYEPLLENARTVWVDKALVMEVFENLFENALRYANQRIRIEFFAGNGELIVTVEDDGAGFPEAAKTLTEPWYHSNPQDDLKHFGLGLYLCRMYCEKHGGGLLLGNRPDGGASAVAVFHEMAPYVRKWKA